MTRLLLLLCCLLAPRATVLVQAANESPAKTSVLPSLGYPERETRTIAGWTVHISRELLTKETKPTERALELLQKQLEEIARVVPTKAVAELRKVPLYVSPEYPGEPPKAEFHPDAGWLREHGRDPGMAKAVEFTNVRLFERESNRMPNFTLHELAHAYQDRVLPCGFENSEIKAAYEKAKQSGKYDEVEQRLGDGRSACGRAYAMTGPQEYFAESTEAFFSTNDFFPFTREELRRHDPEMFALLEKLWEFRKPASSGVNSVDRTAPASSRSSSHPSLATGQTVCRERLGAAGQYMASPASANDHLYLLSAKGVRSVVRRGDRFELVHQAALNAAVAATPAMDQHSLHIQSENAMLAFR